MVTRTTPGSTPANGEPTVAHSAPFRSVEELLRQELSAPTHALSWQLALGAVVDSLPWMDANPFEPCTATLRPVPPLPSFITELWSRPYMPAHQVQLGTPLLESPTPTPVVQPSMSARWSTVPAVQGGACLQTTTGPWLGAPCVAAFGMEDSYIQTGPDWFDEMETRTVLPSFDPCVYEVSSPAAWVRLVERYPSRFEDAKADLHCYQHDLAHWFSHHKLYEPHWPSVANDYDAIHLTQLAYLRCAYTAIPCLDGVTTVTGWGPDVTVWLRHPYP